MKGQSRSRSRARSPESPKLKWRERYKLNCFAPPRGRAKRDQSDDNADDIFNESGLSPMDITVIICPSTPSQGAHPTCKRRERYKLDCFAPPRGRAKRDQSDDDADDIFNESGLSPMDITVICPSTPISKPE